MVYNVSMTKKLLTISTLSLLLIASTQIAQAYTLDIAPSLIEAVQAPSTQNTYDITLTNSASEDITLTPVLYEFAPNSTWDGTIYLTSKNSLPETKPKVANYFSLTVSGLPITQLKIPSGEKKQLQLNVALPEDVPEKDFYTTLLFEDQKNGQGTQVQTGAGTNILLSARNTQNQNINVESFTTDLIHLKNPINFQVLAANSSAHFTKSKANIDIYNMFGRKIATLTSGEKIILANGKRHMTSADNSELKYSQFFMFGYYKAEVSLEKSGAKSEAAFVVIPLAPLLFVIIVTGFGIGVYLRVKKKI